MSKTLIIIILSLLLGASLFLMSRSFFQKKEEGGILALQEVKRIKELHLVSFRYEDIFFYHNRQDKGKKVVVMATVPVTLSAYFDMAQAELKRNDSMLNITLPPVTLSEPNYQVDKMKVQTVRRFSVLAGVDLHQRMLEALSEKISARKVGIVAMAQDNGIEQIALQQAENYFKSLSASLGYNCVVQIRNGISASGGNSKPIEPEIIPLDGIKVLE